MWQQNIFIQFGPLKDKKDNAQKEYRISQIKAEEIDL